MATSAESGAGPIKETLERALAFTEKLLAENARLRRELGVARAQGRDPSRGPAGASRPDRAATPRADARNAADAGKDATTGPELAELRRRFQELEEQNDNLANLYVASYQLHSTLDFREVIATVMEIVVNLIGVESFAVMLVDTKGSDLRAVSSEGMAETPLDHVRLGDGIIGGAALGGEAYYRETDATSPIDLLHPLAAIPLKIQDNVIGMIVAYRLFPQKEGFSSVDYELFKLLAGHAATAIFAARLYTESARRLNTIQGFLDLLTTS